MTWSFFGGKKSGKRKQSGRQTARRGRSTLGARLSRYEHLERRDLLAVLTVNSNVDPGAFGDANLTLREALAVVNAGTTSGLGLSAAELAQIDTTTALGTNDTVNFAGVVSPISLTGQLSIQKAVTIAGPGLTSLTIDGNNTSRIFDIDSTAGDVTIKGLTLTKGLAGVGNDGGAIYSDSLSLLTITNSKITASKGENGGAIFALGNVVLNNTQIGGAGTDGNEATAGDGGGINAQGNVTLINSLVTGNTAADNGGGIFGENTVTLQSSTVDSNAGDHGGGIFAPTASLQSSTVSNNNARLSGGGINGSAVIQNSTISGNKAGALASITGGDGGGIFTTSTVILRNSTVALNRAYGAIVNGDGGGVRADRVTIQNSTVADNRADTTSGHGGGVFASTRLTIQNSIVVGNHDIGDATTLPDINNPATTSVRYSLIGDLGAIPAGGNGTQFEVTGSAAQNDSPFFNFIGRGASVIAMNTVLDVDGLGAARLQNNNGALPATTATIALIGVAIDKGSNALAFGTSTGDQRGLPFARISPLAGTIDMGAFEVQTPPIPVAPTAVAISNQTAAVTAPFTFNVSPPFAAAVPGTLVYSVSVAQINGNVVSPPGTLPSWLTFNPTTGVFTGTPSAADAGTLTINVTATNQIGGLGAGQFVLTVQSAPEMNVQISGVEIPSGGTAASVGSTSTSIVVNGNIQNTASAILNLTGTPRITVSGDNPGDFVVTTQPALAAVPAGGNTTFVVTFTPSANGVRRAVLTIASDDPNENPYVINLQGTGTGIAITTPEINVQVNGVNVASTGSADVGSTGTTISFPVNVQNNGSNVLNLTGSPRIVVSGANASDFVVTTQPVSNIAAGSNSLATVAFTPSGNGVRNATLTIASNDPDENPYVINLTGTGAAVPSFTPFFEDFSDGVADPRIIPQSGNWAVANFAYNASRTPVNNAVVTFNLGTLPASGVTVSTTLRVNPTSRNSSGRTFSNGFVVFDYVDSQNFKIAGIESANNLLVVSQVVGGVYQRLAFRSAKTNANTNYTVSAVVTAFAATVTLNGSTSVSQSFSNNLLTRPVGAATINADTTFDNFSVTG